MCLKFRQLLALFISISLLALPVQQVSANYADRDSAVIEHTQPAHCADMGAAVTEAEQVAGAEDCCCGDCADTCNQGCSSHSTTSAIFGAVILSSAASSTDYENLLQTFSDHDISPPSPPPLA